jgi:Cu(I)/Ag(I) efflux system membrane fusion protein
VELPNAELKLKPEMLATAKIVVDLGRALAVPAAAVMRTGENAYVFKDAGNDKLEPVMVQLGPRAGDWFPVLGDTLKEGDTVVVSANFLIDSEAQVKGALAAMGERHQH